MDIIIQDRQLHNKDMTTVADGTHSLHMHNNTSGLKPLTQTSLMISRIQAKIAMQIIRSNKSHMYLEIRIIST